MSQAKSTLNIDYYIKNMARHFLQLLEYALGNINNQISNLQFLSKQEKKRLLIEFNRNKKVLQKNITICHIFDKQVIKSRHYIAIHWYLPPKEFVTAVMECPECPGASYRKAFLDNGGRDLVRALRAQSKPYNDVARLRLLRQW